MLNYAILDSKYCLNEFTENLIKLIDKSRDGVGYMVRTRRGTCIHTSALNMRESGGVPYFYDVDDTNIWYPDGSCKYSKAFEIGDYIGNDLISSETA